MPYGSSRTRRDTYKLVYFMTEKSECRMLPRCRSDYYCFHDVTDYPVTQTRINYLG